MDANETHGEKLDGNYTRMLHVIRILNKSSLFSNRWRSQYSVCVLSNGNVSVRKYYKQVGSTISKLEKSPYSPDIAPSDYHLFQSMAHGLVEQHMNV